MYRLKVKTWFSGTVTESPDEPGDDVVISVKDSPGVRVSHHMDHPVAGFIPGGYKYEEYHVPILVWLLMIVLFYCALCSITAIFRKQKKYYYQVHDKVYVNTMYRNGSGSGDGYIIPTLHLYSVTIQTGRRPGAGLKSGQVDFSFADSRNSSDTMRVKKAGGHRPPSHIRGKWTSRFSRGSKDNFVVGCTRGLRDIKQFTLVLNKFVPSDPEQKWFVDQVIVKDLEYGHKWCFPCASWIKSDGTPFIFSIGYTDFSFTRLLLVNFWQILKKVFILFSLFRSSRMKSFVSASICLFLCTGELMAVIFLPVLFKVNYKDWCVTLPCAFAISLLFTCVTTFPQLYLKVVRGKKDTSFVDITEGMPLSSQEGSSSNAKRITEAEKSLYYSFSDEEPPDTNVKKKPSLFGTLHTLYRPEEASKFSTEDEKHDGKPETSTEGENQMQKSTNELEEHKSTRSESMAEFVGSKPSLIVSEETSLAFKNFQAKLMAEKEEEAKAHLMAASSDKCLVGGKQTDEEQSLDLDAFTSDKSLVKGKQTDEEQSFDWDTLDVRPFESKPEDLVEDVVKIDLELTGGDRNSVIEMEIEAEPLVWHEKEIEKTEESTKFTTSNDEPEKKLGRCRSEAFQNFAAKVKESAIKNNILPVGPSAVTKGKSGTSQKGTTSVSSKQAKQVTSDVPGHRTRLSNGSRSKSSASQEVKDEQQPSTSGTSPDKHIPKSIKKYAKEIVGTMFSEFPTLSNPGRDVNQRLCDVLVPKVATIVRRASSSSENLGALEPMDDNADTASISSNMSLGYELGSSSSECSTFSNASTLSSEDASTYADESSYVSSIISKSISCISLNNTLSLLEHRVRKIEDKLGSAAKSNFAKLRSQVGLGTKKGHASRLVLEEKALPPSGQSVIDMVKADHAMKLMPEHLEEVLDVSLKKAMEQSLIKTIEEHKTRKMDFRSFSGTMVSEVRNCLVDMLMQRATDACRYTGEISVNWHEVVQERASEIQAKLTPLLEEKISDILQNNVDNVHQVSLDLTMMAYGGHFQETIETNAVLQTYAEFTRKKHMVDVAARSKRSKAKEGGSIMKKHPFFEVYNITENDLTPLNDLSNPTVDRDTMIKGSTVPWHCTAAEAKSLVDGVLAVVLDKLKNLTIDELNDVLQQNEITGVDTVHCRICKDKAIQRIYGHIVENHSGNSVLYCLYERALSKLYNTKEDVYSKGKKDTELDDKFVKTGMELQNIFQEVLEAKKDATRKAALELRGKCLVQAEGEVAQALVLGLLGNPPDDQKMNDMISRLDRVIGNKVKEIKAKQAKQRAEKDKDEDTKGSCHHLKNNSTDDVDEDTKGSCHHLKYDSADDVDKDTIGSCHHLKYDSVDDVDKDTIGSCHHLKYDSVDDVDKDTIGSCHHLKYDSADDVDKDTIGSCHHLKYDSADDVDAEAEDSNTNNNANTQRITSFKSSTRKKPSVNGAIPKRYGQTTGMKRAYGKMNRVSTIKNTTSSKANHRVRTSEASGNDEVAIPIDPEEQAQASNTWIIMSFQKPLGVNFLPYRTTKFASYSENFIVMGTMLLFTLVCIVGIVTVTPSLRPGEVIGAQIWFAIALAIQICIMEPIKVLVLTYVWSKRNGRIYTLEGSYKEIKNEEKEEEDGELQEILTFQ